jgi:glycosyltransferase involved in cell wall biosynthesis
MTKEENIKPLISVIIPCYNAALYVEQAILSIMNQTYKRLEILCTDDCSTDSTLFILEKLASKDCRIRIIRHTENKKLIFTLNELVQASTGDFIARMDADDISLPERLEKQIEFLQQNSDISFCGTNSWHIDEDGKKIGKSRLPLTSEDNRFFLPFYSTFYHPTVMARAEVFKKNRYSPDFVHVEDYELWCRLIFEKGLKGVNLKERLFLYRLNSQGVSAQNRQEQQERSFSIICKYNLCEKNYLNLYKQIFFVQSERPSKETKKYIETIYNTLKRKYMQYAIIPVKKIMFYLLKFNSPMFFCFLLTKFGFYILFEHLLKRN